LTLPFLRRKTGPGLHNLSFTDRIWLARQMRNVARMVGEHGWVPVPVEAPGGPSWVYTVGFDETLAHPELIMFDTPYEAAAGEIHSAFEQLRSGELTIEDGMVWAEEGAARCVVRKVHPERISGEGWFSLALHRRRIVKRDYHGLAAYQLVLTDKSGRLPWEAGYDESVRRFQPALYLPRDQDPASAAAGAPHR
jgi:hypothetical protein